MLRRFNIALTCSKFSSLMRNSRKLNSLAKTALRMLSLWHYLFIVLPTVNMLLLFTMWMTIRLFYFLNVTKMYKPRYFKEVEFVRCTPPCELTDMDELLLRKLDEARKLADMPFILNSAYRSVEHERSHGRTGTSSHCKGLAVDLHCSSSYVRFRLIEALIKVGFRRIGIYENFIHADLDNDKISAVWLSNCDICRG